MDEDAREEEVDSVADRGRCWVVTIGVSVAADWAFLVCKVTVGDFGELLISIEVVVDEPLLLFCTRFVSVIS